MQASLLSIFISLSLEIVKLIERYYSFVRFLFLPLCGVCTIFCFTVFHDLKKSIKTTDVQKRLIIYQITLIS